MAAQRGQHPVALPPVALPPVAVEVRRSPRRRRTVSAYRDGERVVVLIPDAMSPGEERHWVSTMVERLAAQEARRRPSDERLAARADELSRRYLGGRADPTSVRWVQNMSLRWGSCTPADGSIRLSAALRSMPGWVQDYVLLHELAHLILPEHGPAFWSLLQGYARTERARGFLEGVAATTRGRPVDPTVPGLDGDEEPECTEEMGSCTERRETG
ncbi:MAG: M48 metallopeptidase family protein [Actinomycetes bacterium]